MNDFNALDILQACINELNSTTKEEFDNKRKELGIYNKIYNREEYINDEVEILFELDKSTGVQQNSSNFEYGDEFMILSLDQDDNYNVCSQSNSLVIENNYMTNNLCCEQTNSFALAA